MWGQPFVPTEYPPSVVIPSEVEEPAFCCLVQNLVKPPKAPNSRQASDSTAKINPETMALLPSGFAILKVGIKTGASFQACAFSFVTTPSYSRKCPNPSAPPADAPERPRKAAPGKPPKRKEARDQKKENKVNWLS